MSNSSRAFSYLVVIAATLIGAWLFFGRTTQADAPPPADVTVELVPQVFQAGDQTCVYIGGELDCFCPCTLTESCASYGDIILPEPKVITVPQIVTVPLIITRTVEVPVMVTQSESQGETGAGSTASGTSLSGSQSGSQSGSTSLSGSQAGSSSWASTSRTIAGTEGQDTQGKPEKEEKPPCNQGVGNSTEDCDPGNSNQGDPNRSNDELVTTPDGDEHTGTPGDPGRKGGNKVGHDKEEPTQ